MPDLGTIPKAMRGRPVDHRGYPVPWFVTERDARGRWDFTRITPERAVEAVRRGVCWVSGEPLGRWVTFIVDSPDQRFVGDRGMKRDVAEWAVRVCPRLALGTPRPKAAAARNGIDDRSASGVLYLYTTGQWAWDEDNPSGPVALGPAQEIVERRRMVKADAVAARTASSAAHRLGRAM